MRKMGSLECNNSAVKFNQTNLPVNIQGQCWSFQPLLYLWMVNYFVYFLRDIMKWRAHTGIDHQLLNTKGGDENWKKTFKLETDWTVSINFLFSSSIFWMTPQRSAKVIRTQNVARLFGVLLLKLYKHTSGYDDAVDKKEHF